MELVRLWKIDVDLVFHHVSLRSDRFPLKLSQTLDPPPPLSHRLLFPSSQWEATVVVSDSDLRYWFLINPHICTGICECTLHPLHHYHYLASWKVASFHLLYTNNTYTWIHLTTSFVSSSSIEGGFQPIVVAKECF